MLATLDATPLIGPRTGVGHYVAHLLAGLVSLLAPGELVGAGAVTWQGHDELRLPPGVLRRGRRVPARGARLLWGRTGLLSGELVLGRADVVHGTNFVLPPLRRARGVVTVHDLAFELHPELVAPRSADLRRLVPRSLARADVVLTPSRSAALDVQAVYGIPADRVVVTPLGVDEEWFAAVPLTEQARHRLGLPTDYVVFVGTQEPRKNLGTLLDAHRAWRALDPAAPSLVLAGPAGWGDLPTGGPPGTVLRTGYLDQADLRSVVAGARALVLPSHHEGFGLPVVEAMACGTPVVTSDLPVFREVSGGQALTAPALDPDALAAQLAVAVEDTDPAARRRRVTQARTMSWRRCAALTLEVYRELS